VHQNMQLLHCAAIKTSPSAGGERVAVIWLLITYLLTAFLLTCCCEMVFTRCWSPIGSHICCRLCSLPPCLFHRNALGVVGAQCGVIKLTKQVGLSSTITSSAQPLLNTPVGASSALLAGRPCQRPSHAQPAASVQSAVKALKQLTTVVTKDFGDGRQAVTPPTNPTLPVEHAATALAQSPPTPNMPEQRKHSPALPPDGSQKHLALAQRPANQATHPANSGAPNPAHP
jgi:hypothetical protein